VGRARELATETGGLLGCGSVSSVPLLLVAFLRYTHALAVALGTPCRVSHDAVR
jgi:hypothetical protein